MVTLIQQILVVLMQHQQVIQIEVAALVIVRLLVWQIVTVLDSFFCLLPNRTGCRFWNGKLKFIPEKAAYTAHKWIWIGAAGLLIMVLCILCYQLRRDPVTPGPPNDRFMGDDLKVFSYESVMAATDNFSGENKLGEGGFGPVYKGSMPTGQEIAVKTLSSGSVQGEVEFKNELILISELQHINLVQLFGYCIHGEERMLIYEYMANKLTKVWTTFYLIQPAACF
ncbi:G-type lectin S-receptor-like serine/threonine-protein kinase CES101 isoform X1 [Rosa rugosa]|uniref:G-type lectin S-receptor-like serine/threonine-protein kinase CES101 isoform X1 n=1 Tax=Rosa rugosa TaxID=74645 RepID=UPI002B40E6B3|nr:G-type lectin S-receptor-like serine/threonine-protein kinase CES101 isoform X1 [Rosa rugosa]